MSFESTKNFWDNQAKKYSVKPEATTNDYYMREIEIKCLIDEINARLSSIKTIADIGCGNGFSTLELARKYPDINFTGFDYSEEMIKNANLIKEKHKIQNIDFYVLDLTKDNISSLYDFIYTDRCLINLPSWDDQKNGLDKIYDALNIGGFYLMIENFIDGQNNFNKIREQFGLNPINVREHNLFFIKEDLHEYFTNKFKIIDYKNISSQYYLVSRVIYSKICQEQGVNPDYYDIHHKLGSELPFEGNNGPISMYSLKKV